jgi:hypothetical protein
VTSAEVLALFDEDSEPGTLARRLFYVEGPSRDGTTSGREQAGGVIVHKPKAALLLPSDFPPLSRRRPDFPGLRHVLVRFGFMLDRLPPRHAYESATITITLDDPDAEVLAQRPSLVTTETEWSDSTTTEVSAALDSLAKIGAQRTRVTERGHRTSLPLVTAENRGPAGFGWHYQAQDGAPLHPQLESARAVIELPRAAVELAGAIEAEAAVAFPRYGVITRSKAAPETAAARFLLPLGSAG